MFTRSRGGCLDCKKAKVKCDEARPSCGTCARRKHVCHGYKRAAPFARKLKVLDAQSINGFEHQNSERADLNLTTPITRPKSYDKKNGTIPASMVVISTDAVTSAASSGLNPRSKLSPGSCTKEPFLSLRRLAPIPSGAIPPEDEPVIELYFTRHPNELVIGPEFIHEMNANVIQVLESNPAAIADPLFAIGQIYLSGTHCGMMLPVFNRKGRILSRLREIPGPHFNLEQTMVLLLGLAAMELIDVTLNPGEESLPVIIANSATIINHHIKAGFELSSMAKYFIRAIARQDMMLALTNLKPPCIPTSVWLDEECRKSADRFMGYTTTFMPLLAELASLAAETRMVTKFPLFTTETLPFQKEENAPRYSCILFDRAADLHSRLSLWRPSSDLNSSFELTRKFLLQAHSYRSAALLYLYRLFYPPGKSEGADQFALNMAHDILVYTGGPPDDVRMLLWPLFIAACELSCAVDRFGALQMFENIRISRHTATVLRTRSFCVDRVWKARDTGADWNWMDLVPQFPGELQPV